MKYLFVVACCIFSLQSYAQTNDALLKHYEAYYKQMKKQGDAQGVINALTHITVIQPTQAKKDTLAMIYMSEGRHVQALNTIGIDKNASDSDIAVEVKAVSLKALNESERALVHFEELYKRSPDVSVAYELAELYLQTKDLEASSKYIEYGLANATDNMGKAFYETQQPYKVPMKAAFLYLKALKTFNENRAANIDKAIAFLDEAVKIAPNFNMAQISKNALLSQKKESTPKE